MDERAPPSDSDIGSGTGPGSGPGDDRRRLPLLNLLPNFITLLGLCAGLTAIRYAIDGRYELAAGLIILAAVLDGMDGMVARKLNAASHFGAELDSLSDFVCFGVAPAILVYHFALQSMAGLGWLLALVFALCACLRLARFNVGRNAPPPPGRAYFVGVPAPAGAMLGLLPLYLTLAGIWDMRALPVAVALYLAFVGLLMISRLPTLSPKALSVPRNRAIWLLVGVAVVAGAAVTRPWLVLVLADLAYLAVLAQGAYVHRRRLT